MSFGDEAKNQQFDGHTEIKPYITFFFCLPGNFFGDVHGIWGLAIEATHGCLFFAEECLPNVRYQLVPCEKDQR